MDWPHLDYRGQLMFCFIYIGMKFQCHFAMYSSMFSGTQFINKRECEKKWFRYISKTRANLKKLSAYSGSATSVYLKIDLTLRVFRKNFFCWPMVFNASVINFVDE